jgi:hypothetical protein
VALDEVEIRIEVNGRDHAMLLDERGRYLATLNLELDKYLDVNKQLASRYRTLKYDLYNVRFNLMRKIEIKLTKLVSVKDKRQMKSLQDRMHFALKDFFNYKSL